MHTPGRPKCEYRSAQHESTLMSTVLISTKGQIVLPIAVRKALGLKPGMRVSVKLDGKHARVSLAPDKKSASLDDIHALLKYDGPTVPIEAMRATDYPG